MALWSAGSRKAYREIRRLAVGLLSSPRLVNHVAYRRVERKYIDLKAARMERRPPQMLNIETTNHCNAQCVMCPNPTMSRTKALMTDEIYDRVVAEAAATGVRKVNIHSIGEPLLDKKLPRRIAQAKKAGLWVTTSTNGSLLDRKAAADLLDSGIDEVNISVDGFTQKTYEAIRLGLSFDEVTSNIEYFLTLRKERGLTKPTVILRFLDLADNAGEARRFVERWENLADQVLITNAHDWAGGVADRFRGDFHSRALRTAPCKLLWQEFIVLHDGRIAACCHDYEGTMILGDLKRESLADIWNGEPMMKLRQAHKTGRLADYPTCQACQINTVWWG